MFLSKYGVARHIYLPIVKAGVNDFAVSGDWTPASGDVKISKDGGTAANVTNLPTAITMGNGAIWDFSLTATEMEAAQIIITVVDSSTKAVEDQSFIIETYGNASGQHAFDLDTATQDVNVTQFGGSNGAFASGRPEVNATHIAGSAVDTATAQIGANVVSYASGQAPLQPTTAGRTLDVSAGGEAGIDWANVGSPTTTVDLSGTTISTSQAVASVSGAVGSVTGNVGGNVTGSIGSLATQAKADVNAEVVDTLATDTYAEPGQGAPAATTSLAAKINYLFKAWRNKVTQTSTEYALYADDGTTKDQAATVSDDGTTFTRGEVGTGA